MEALRSPFSHAEIELKQAIRGCQCTNTKENEASAGGFHCAITCAVCIAIRGPLPRIIIQLRAKKSIDLH